MLLIRTRAFVLRRTFICICSCLRVSACQQTGLVQASAPVNPCPMPDNQTSSQTAMTVDMNTVGGACVCVCVCLSGVSGGGAFTSQSLK